MIHLRPYQTKLDNEINDAWRRGQKHVLAVAPTGAGKTAVMSNLFKTNNVPSCAIAHRQELVSQISLAMARNEVPHNVIASEKVIQFCVRQHVKETGKVWHNTRSNAAVAGVQTLIRRERELFQWRNSVRLWAMDEAHHVLPANSWGKAVEFFPNALGVGFTASPVRCDKKPLGAAYGGVFHEMVLGPTMRQLIDGGYLTDYRIFAPKQSIDLARIKISSTTGDYNQDSLRKEAHKSTITGDVVDSYVRFAKGKRTIVFVVDVEQAKEVAAKFERVGITAEAVSAKTSDDIRQGAIERFRNGKTTVLVNVDLFGEGFDVPAVECVIMGRPTQSLGLYIQQFGRALRPCEGKTHGIIIDHVGNVVRHGLPDAKTDWTLDQNEVNKSSGRLPVIPIAVCNNCWLNYERRSFKCPNCGYVHQPAGRDLPEQVDGDLEEFSPELLARLRGEIASIETRGPAIPMNAAPEVIGRLKKLHGERQDELAALRETMNQWAGMNQTLRGMTRNECYRVFYFKFGVDVLTAQTLKRAEMIDLRAKIERDMP